MDEPTRCGECRRELEACACCDREDCPHPTCYPDLAVSLGISIPTLHTHGG